MSAIDYQHLALDWQPSNGNQRDFYRIGIVVLCLTLVLAVLLSVISVPEKERRANQVVPDRIAKFISQKAKPPVPVEKPKPKVEPKPKLPPKLEEKPKPTIERKKPSEAVEQKPLTETQQKARETAANSGLLALSNELNDLVDSGDVAAKVAGKLTTNAATANQTAGHNTDIISGNVAKTGGRVDAAQYGAAVSSTELSAREVVQAKSELLVENTPATKNTAGAAKTTGGRSYEENVTVIFDKNKGSLYALYDRERRKTPGLKGKIVLEITISTTGDVTNVKIVSSTLNNPSLESRIVGRIKQFKFGTNGSGPTTITYPIEFLPS